VPKFSIFSGLFQTYRAHCMLCDTLSSLCDNFLRHVIFVGVWTFDVKYLMSSSEGAILVDSEGENEKENTNCLKTESKKVREIKSRSRATSSRRSLNSRSSTLQKKKIKESVKVSKDVSDSPVEETVSGSGDDFAPELINMNILLFCPF
jgi:hypothetical protein